MNTEARGSRPAAEPAARVPDAPAMSRRLLFDLGRPAAANVSRVSGGGAEPNQARRDVGGDFDAGLSPTQR